MNASDLSHQLGLNAEVVCRAYLGNGVKSGRYWLVGNAQNDKGRSLFVRLSGPGIVGKWNDPAADQHGDLLDIIRLSQGLPDLRSTMAEAERFLGHTRSLPPQPTSKSSQFSRADMAKRLYTTSRPLADTLGVTYLNQRGIALCEEMQLLRFDARIWFNARTFHPALIAPVRNNAGNMTGIMRLFLDNNANLIERRALGHLNGNAVRIGPVNAARLLVGEGLESTLSFTVTHPGQALAATLSAAHMAAFIIPVVVRHLIIAADNDPAGRNAAAKLHTRALKQGVETRIILPRLADFNDDLVALQ